MIRALVIALVCGTLFGLGLVISGMANPAKVLGFLRLGRGWDPQLAVVMASALVVTLPGFAWLRRHGQPQSLALAKPPMAEPDTALCVGAALFGIGWGLVGYCPGPAIAAAGLGHGAAVAVLVAMLVGASLPQPSFKTRSTELPHV